MILLLSLFTVRIDTVLEGNILKTGYRNIVLNSERIVHRDTTLVRNIDYSIDYPLGIIRIFRIYNDTIHISFTALGDEFPSVYQKYTPGRVKKFNEVKEDSIRINGWNGFYVDVSGDGTGISHTLDLTIQGRVKGFEINGKVSDNQFPYQYGLLGLNQVDNLYMEIVSPSMGIRLGNFIQKIGEKETRITGFKGYFRGLEATAGFSGTREVSTLLELEDGIPGPYSLRDESGKRVWIITGSESVYLNGKKLERDKDYVLDYEKGEITFTASHYIRHTDVVQVIFQYLPGGSNETIYTAGYRWKDGRLLFQRSDDLLENILIHKAVPESGIVYVYNAEYRGTGMGDYNLVDSHFVYAGSMKGAYSVNFQYVGGDSGEYVFNDSLGYFVFQGSGDWTALRKIPLNGEMNTVYLNFKKEAGPVEVEITGEARGQRFTGEAYNYTGVSLTNVLFNLGENISISISGFYRDGDNFQYLENIEGNMKTQWGKDVKDACTFTISLKPLRDVKILAGGGKAEDRLLKKISLNMGNITFDYLDVDKFKEHIGVKFIKGNIELGAVQEVQDSLYRRYGLLNLGFIKGEAGREGNLISGLYKDTTAFYKGDIFLKTHLLNLKGNMIMRKSLKDGRRRMQVNLAPTLQHQWRNRGIKVSGLIQEHLETKMIAVYRRVGEGLGNYSYDSISGSYYQNPYGDYMRDIIPSDSLERTRRYRVIMDFINRSPFSLEVSGILDMRGEDFTEDGHLHTMIPLRKNFGIEARTEIKRERFSLLGGGFDTRFRREYNAGFYFKKGNACGGYRVTSDEERKFIRLRLNGLLKLNNEAGEIDTKGNKIMFIEFEPSIQVGKGNISLEISHYKYKIRVYEISTYPEGATITLKPSLNLHFNNLNFSITGFYRTYPDRSPIYYIRLGGETRI